MQVVWFGDLELLRARCLGVEEAIGLEVLWGLVISDDTFEIGCGLIQICGVGLSLEEIRFAITDESVQPVNFFRLVLDMLNLTQFFLKVGLEAFMLILE